MGEEMNRWHHADTAPKDGSAIIAWLLYRGDEIEQGYADVVRWHTPWRQWVLANVLIGIQNNAKDEECVDLVAWMPTPKMPSLSINGEI